MCLVTRQASEGRGRRRRSALSCVPSRPTRALPQAFACVCPIVLPSTPAAATGTGGAAGVQAGAGTVGDQAGTYEPDP